MLYTWKNLRIRNRFEFSKRDVNITKIKIINKLVYQPMKKGLASYDEKLEIQSFSTPQYKPYTNHLKSKTSRQRKYKHQYDCVLVLQKDNKGNYSYDSLIKWRIGSYKKYVDHPIQSAIKSVYRETTNKLKKKYSNDPVKYREEIKRVRARGKYLSVGDYNIMVNGIMPDAYFRDYYLQYINGCLYGPIYFKQRSTKEPNILFPFFDKHLIALIFFLTRKNIIKHERYILK